MKVNARGEGALNLAQAQQLAVYSGKIMAFF